MSVISQQRAYDISYALTVKKEKDFKKEESALEALAYKFYMDQIPEPVRKLWKTHPQYLDDTLHVYVGGPGMAEKEYINMKKKAPTKNNSSVVILSAEDADTFKTQRDKVLFLKQELNKLRKEIENALLACRTFKKAIDNFPEAAPYLPTEGKRDLILNFEDTRRKLKEIPTPVPAK